MDGVILEFKNITMTSLAMSAIIAKVRDGCIVTFTNINVTPEGLDKMLGIGEKSDGLIINLTNAAIPQKVMELMKSKKGDGCIFTHQM